MLNFFAFLFALTLLVSVHEWGHYRVAVGLGVKVLRFSIGLGRPIWRWGQPQPGSVPIQGTEFTIGWLPLGGYVLMLDEANGPISPEHAHQAFNRQPLWARACIVAAGPVANLLLAVILLATASWWGQEEPAPILSTPLAQSPAEQAGLLGGERVLAAGGIHELPASDDLASLALKPMTSFLQLQTLATETLRDEQDWVLEVQDSLRPNASPRRVRLSIAQLPSPVAAGNAERVAPLEQWGLGAPRAEPVVNRVEPGSPAAKAGVLSGDWVRKVQGQSVPDAQFLRHAIRQSVVSGSPQPLNLEVVRDQQVLELQVQAVMVEQAGLKIGRIGIAVGATPHLEWVQYTPLESAFLGIQKTYALTALTLRTVGDWVTGQGGLDQLGGPLAIADQAGRSAHVGLAAYLGFLGFLSISLGVLNLLPLPMLDGGHLMYYLWELLTGKTVSPAWVNGLQKVGLMLLVFVMVTALVNDGIRLLR
jgi:regulator of sigma E protease